MTTKDSNTTAYDPISGRKYASWEDLVDDQAVGYVVILTSDRPNTGALVYGPYTPATYGGWAEAKAAAEKARVRLRQKTMRYERQAHGTGIKISSSVRYQWKDMS